MNLKKLLSLFLVSAVFVSISIPAVAEEASTEAFAATIKEQIFNLNTEENGFVSSAETVTLAAPLTRAATENAEETALKATIEHSDMKEDVYIFPYKILADGSLQNSFEYAKMVTRGSEDVDYHYNLVDMVLYCSAYFESKPNTTTLARLYQTYGVGARWDSNARAAYVNNMDVQLTARGIEYNYYTLEPTGRGEATYNSRVYEIAPTKNFAYADWSHQMPSNICLYMEHPFEHTGTMDFNINYTTEGGIQRNAAYSWELFSK